MNEMTRLILSYTILRLSLFGVVFVLLLLTSLPGILDVALALVASALLSLVIARGQRNRLGELYLERRDSRARPR